MDKINKIPIGQDDILSCILSYLGNSLKTLCRLQLVCNAFDRRIPTLITQVSVRSFDEIDYLSRHAALDKLVSMNLVAPTRPFSIPNIEVIFQREHLKWNRLRRLRIHSSQATKLLPFIVSTCEGIETLIIVEEFMPAIFYTDDAAEIWNFASKFTKLKQLVVPPSAVFSILRDHADLNDFLHHFRLACPPHLNPHRDVAVWLSDAIPVAFWWIGSALPKDVPLETCIKALDYVENINWQFEGGDTPLTHLIRHEKFFNSDEHHLLAKAILERGGDPLQNVTLQTGLVTNALLLSAAIPFTLGIPSIFEMMFQSCVSSGRLQRGSLEGVLTSSGHTPLHLTSYHAFDQIKIVHKRLVEDLDLNILEYSDCIDGETPLLTTTTACETGTARAPFSATVKRSIESISAFFQLGANVFAMANPTTPGWTRSILHQILPTTPHVFPQDEAALELLMEKFDSNSSDENFLQKIGQSNPPLDIDAAWIIKAANPRNTHLRRVILKLAPYNTATYQNDRSLWSRPLIEQNRTIGLTREAIGWLVAQGADVNYVAPRELHHTTTEAGFLTLNSTPLMAAACIAPADLVPFLLDLGADPTLSPHGSTLLDVLSFQCKGIVGELKPVKLIHDVSLRFLERGLAPEVVRTLKNLRGSEYENESLIQDLFLDVVNPSGKWIDSLCNDSEAVELALIQCLFPTNLLTRMADNEHVALIKKLWSKITPSILAKNPALLYLALGTASTSRPLVVGLVEELLVLPNDQWCYFNPMFTRCANLLASNPGHLSLDLIVRVFEKFASLDLPPSFNQAPVISRIPSPRILQAAFANPQCFPDESITVHLLYCAINPDVRLENFKLLLSHPKSATCSRDGIVEFAIQTVAALSTSSVPPDAVVDGFVQVFEYLFEHGANRNFFIQGQSLDEYYRHLVPEATRRSRKISECFAVGSHDKPLDNVN